MGLLCEVSNYLFLSIFRQCSRYSPETASASAILDLMSVAGSLVEMAREQARVSLQPFFRRDRWM